MNLITKRLHLDWLTLYVLEPFQLPVVDVSDGSFAYAAKRGQVYWMARPICRARKHFGRHTKLEVSGEWMRDLSVPECCQVVLRVLRLLGARQAYSTRVDVAVELAAGGPRLIEGTAEDFVRSPTGWTDYVRDESGILLRHYEFVGKPQRLEAQVRMERSEWLGGVAYAVCQFRERTLRWAPKSGAWVGVAAATATLQPAPAEVQGCLVAARRGAGMMRRWASGLRGPEAAVANGLIGWLGQGATGGFDALARALFGLVRLLDNPTQEDCGLPLSEGGGSPRSVQECVLLHALAPRQGGRTLGDKVCKNATQGSPSLVWRSCPTCGADCPTLAAVRRLFSVGEDGLPHLARILLEYQVGGDEHERGHAEVEGVVGS